MAYHKNWEDLDIADDFIFGKVMQKPDLCKELIERILEIEIDHVEYPELQKTIDLQVDARSVRLDVYVKDGQNTVYNIEMQTTNQDDLAKRSRYYQGMIDLNLIEKGMYFRELPKSYVIFICTFDLFGEGRHKYTFENRCEHNRELLLGDDAVKIFLNAASNQDDVSPALKAFLDYVVGQKGTDTFVQRLEQEITTIKSNEMWRREYMTLYMRDMENFEKGKQEGREEGRQEGRQEVIEQCVEKLLNAMPRKQIASVLNLPIDYINQVADRVKNM